MKGMVELFRGAGAKKRTVPVLSLILMACLLLGGSTAFAAQIAYYPLDGSAADVSGNGYNGTVNEATFVTGKYGQAASFDNVNDDITVSSLAGFLPGGNAARTVAFWVKPSTTADNGNMVSWGAPANGQRFSVLMEAGGRLDVIGQFYDFQSTYTMSAGVWQHVAVTYDGTSLKFYANGVLQGTSIAGAFNTNASNALRIGTNVVGWDTEYFGGEIDDVRIYDNALSASEVWALAYLMGGSIQGTPLDLTIGHSDVTTLAGLAGSAGGTDGTGSAARFSSPHGLTTDGTNLYVADHDGYVIRKIVISTGQVTTIAGTYGSAGSTDGTGSAARFNKPTAMATDGVNLYVADYNNHTVRKIVLSTGVVTTLAGSAGLAGSTDGTGSAARFNYPNGLTMIGGYLYLSEMGNHTIRRINISTAAVTTFAGSAGLTGTTDATGTAARFNTPCGVTTDGTNLYVVDLNNYTVRKIVISSAAVTTLAGMAGVSNWLDGTGTAAQFKGIEMITTDGTYLYVSDWGSSTIRRITISSGAVTTIAGSNGLSGSTDGLGSAARFFTNEGLTTDGTNLFIADRGNNTIRKISYVNSAPVITSNGGGATASVSVSENQTAVTTVTTTDTNSDTITYSITGGSDSAKFSINSSTGVLTFVSAPDYEVPTDSDVNNTYIVTVQASDGSLTDSQTITVTVTNVNEAPDITPPTTTASPAGGTYSSSQSVTLTPNETATTYYCTGESCTPGTVYSSAINVSSSTTLRFYSKDASNNSESVKTERYSISPSTGLSYTGQNTGGGGMDSRAGVTKSDFEGGDIEGSDADNLDSGKARFDVLYNFTVLLVDDTGESPQVSPKLYVAHKNSPTEGAGGDFFKYDLTCTGSTWGTGKTCTIPMPLGPAAVSKYYFTATKTTGGIVRLPSSGYLDGPTVKTLNGWAIVSAAKDIDAATLSAATALGNSSALEWVSTGLDAVYNSVFSGYWQTPSSIKKGRAYFINGGSGTLPELAGYSNAAAANVEITLQQGWNLIATPYNGNVKLSDVFVRKGAGPNETWTTATTNNWVYNTLWNFNGSGWGNTYRSDSAGGSPDAVMAPWMGYWIYLRVNDDTYTLVIPKPAQ